MLCLWYLLAAATIARDDSGLSPTCKACLIVSEGAANALRDRSSYTFGEVDDVVADFLEAHGAVWRVLWRLVGAPARERGGVRTHATSEEPRLARRTSHAARASLQNFLTS